VDTDGDGLSDAEEDLNGNGVWDEGSEPNPEDADSDDDGLYDGPATDSSGTLLGPWEPNWLLDTDGDGLINVLDSDSDDDGVHDGTEAGVSVAIADPDGAAGPLLGTDEAAMAPDGRPDFIADADDGATDSAGTTTFVLDPDTDNGGLSDGSEDINGNGQVDAGETDPNNAADDGGAGGPDADNDGISDADEDVNGNGEVDDGETDPNDADSDDDGVLDGSEGNSSVSPGGAWNEDFDGDGLINALDPDSDNDGLFDGTEIGITTPIPAAGGVKGTDTSAGNFIADEDPATTTNPLNPDTDGGTVYDGDEDVNKNGRVDEGETDPNNIDDDNTKGGPAGRSIFGFCNFASDAPVSASLLFFLVVLCAVAFRRRETTV